MSCVIEECKSHTGRNSQERKRLSFHRFPKDEDIKREWLQRVGRPNWKWNKRSHICSKHFTPESFVPNINSKWRRLKADALPLLCLSSDTNSLERAQVPRDIDDAYGEASRAESHLDFDIEIKEEEITAPLEVCEYFQEIVSEPMEVCKMESPAESCKHISEESIQQNMVPPLSNIKQKTSEETACCRHEKYISRLQQQLAKVKKVSQRRLKKINTLTKRLSRVSKKTDDLYTILIDRLKEDNIETEFLALFNNMNKNDVIKR